MDAQYSDENMLIPLGSLDEIGVQCTWTTFGRSFTTRITQNTWIYVYNSTPSPMFVSQRISAAINYIYSFATHTHTLRCPTNNHTSSQHIHAHRIVPLSNCFFFCLFVVSFFSTSIYAELLWALVTMAIAVPDPNIVCRPAIVPATIYSASRLLSVAIVRTTPATSALHKHEAPATIRVQTQQPKQQSSIPNCPSQVRTFRILIDCFWMRIVAAMVITRHCEPT